MFKRINIRRSELDEFSMALAMDLKRRYADFSPRVHTAFEPGPSSDSSDCPDVHLFSKKDNDTVEIVTEIFFGQEYLEIRSEAYRAGWRKEANSIVDGLDHSQLKYHEASVYYDDPEMFHVIDQIVKKMHEDY